MSESPLAVASEPIQHGASKLPLLRMTRGDWDGLFGLFVDNLLQLLLIVALCPLACGFSLEFITSRVLPGAALSILLGNAFYTWQAWRLARQTGREDVTALPYGINTVSLVAYIVFIMGPVYRETQDSDLAWKVGLFACLLSGAMELAGALFGGALRRHAPRAALLSALAGVAITFIAMGFVFQVFASPGYGLLPLLLILVLYAGKVRLPGGLPGGFAAVLLGTALAWGLRAVGLGAQLSPPPTVAPGLYPPWWSGGEVFAFLVQPVGWKYLAVIFPMALFNVLGSLQCLESAEAAGDTYPTRSSLTANGLGSLVAACFGSPFPTTIYIGHPGWKDMGARWGYSLVNGVILFVLSVLGMVAALLRIMPLEVALGILLWIGLVITAQAFQASPRRHALAVGIGLIPALASWAVYLVETTLRVAGTSLYETVDQFGSQLFVHGIIALSQGFLLTSIIYAAVLAFVIDREFRKAALWMLVASGLSAVGLMHAYEVTVTGIQNKFGWMAAPEFVAVYAVMALILWLLGKRASAEATTGVASNGSGMGSP